MKPKVVILLIVAFVSVASARSAHAQSTNIWDRACNQIGEIAQTTMRERQNNTPLSTMIARNEEAFAGQTDASSMEYSAILRGMILSAYDIPRYSTRRYQDEEVGDFRNEVETTRFQGRLIEFAE